MPAYIFITHSQIIKIFTLFTWTFENVNTNTTTLQVRYWNYANKLRETIARNVSGIEKDDFPFKFSAMKIDIDKGKALTILLFVLPLFIPRDGEIVWPAND